MNHEPLLQRKRRGKIRVHDARVVVGLAGKVGRAAGAIVVTSGTVCLFSVHNGEHVPVDRVRTANVNSDLVHQLHVVQTVHGHVGVVRLCANDKQVRSVARGAQIVRTPKRQLFSMYRQHFAVRCKAEGMQ